MRPQNIELPFPLLGVSGDHALSRTPDGMAPDALNVVGFDPIGDRLRGGQRPGLSKHFTTQFGADGGSRIQAMRQNTIAVQKVDGTKTREEPFTADDNPLWSELAANWNHYEGNFDGQPQVNNPFAAVLTTDTISPVIDTNEARWTDAGAGLYGSYHLYDGDALVLGNGYSVEADVKFSRLAGSEFGFFTLLFQVDPALGGEAWGVQLSYTYFGGNPQYILWNLKKTGSAYLLHDTSNFTVVTAYDLENWINFKVEVYTDNTIKVYLADTIVATWTYGGTYSAALTGVGFGGALSDLTNINVYSDNWLATTPAGIDPVEAYHAPAVVIVSNGNVYQSTSGAEPTLCTNGDGAQHRTVRRVAAINHHGADGDGGAAAYQQFVYLCDGSLYKRLNVATETVTIWTADAGTLPVDVSGNIANMGVKYRDRVVLAGLLDDPHNWFMSAVGDALNFDYGATVTATMAVAGNNTNAGEIGDTLTCLAPYSDDVMLMGGDHTTWIMRGDPAARGIIDNLSYKTGIAGPRAFAWDPKGNIHFFGAGTHWVMNAEGASPEAISRGRMDRIWRALDLSTNEIILSWDVRREGLHICVVPWTQGTPTHWFWDAKTNAYWPIQYPGAMGPTAMLEFDADSPNDNALLLGGYDGYVRKYDSDATSDDGTAISSSVIFTPVQLGGSEQNTKCQGATVIMGNNSGDATFEVYAGESPQTAQDLGKKVFQRVVSAGRNQIINRVMGNTILFRISNSVLDARWVCETMNVKLAAAGRTRKGSL